MAPLVLLVAAGDTRLTEEAREALGSAGEVRIDPTLPLPLRLSVPPQHLARGEEGAGGRVVCLCRQGQEGAFAVPHASYLAAGRPPADGPLRGRTLLLTRPWDRQEPLASSLEGLGAVVLRLPLTRQEPLPEGELRQRVGELDRYDWIAFLSRSALPPLLPLLARAARGGRLPRLAAVGPATAAALRAAGYEVDLVPAIEDAQHLAEALLVQGPSPARLLLPQAEGGRETLAERLRQEGWDVARVRAYRTVGVSHPLASEVADSLREGAVDGVVFAAPSAVAAFQASIAAVGRAVAIAIGPETGAALVAAGFPDVRVAKRYTGDGLVEAILGEMGDPTWQRRRHPPTSP